MGRSRRETMLSDLPREALERIFRAMPPSDCARSTAVCRRFAEVAGPLAPRGPACDLPPPPTYRDVEPRSGTWVSMGNDIYDMVQFADAHDMAGIMQNRAGDAPPSRGARHCLAHDKLREQVATSSVKYDRVRLTLELPYEYTSVEIDLRADDPTPYDFDPFILASTDSTLVLDIENTKAYAYAVSLRIGNDRWARPRLAPGLSVPELGLGIVYDHDIEAWSLVASRDASRGTILRRCRAVLEFARALAYARAKGAGVMAMGDRSCAVNGTPADLRLINRFSSYVARCFEAYDA